MASRFLVLLIVALASSSTLACPVQPPCQCSNKTNPYTLKLEYIVDCSSLGLTLVPKFTGGEKVDRILLNGNKIIKVSNGSFIGVTTGAIDLSSNGLQIIAAGAFEGLEKSLTDIQLSTNNLILPIPGLLRLTALKTLNLDYNPNMRTIYTKSFYGLTSLTKLVLSRSYINRFEQGAFEGLPALTDLDFYGNLLSEVPPELSVLTNLQTLNFDANDISQIPADAFKGLPNLKELQLSRNKFSGAGQIDADAFKGLDNLEILGFYYDMLGHIPKQTFSHLKKLTNLDMSYNSLTKISLGDLAGLNSLTQLDISGNSVHFQPGMFSDVSKTLNYILIRSNGLTALPIAALQEVKSLQWIDAALSDFPKDLPANFASGLSINRLSLMWMNLTSIRPDTFNGLASPLHLDLDSNALRSLDFVTDLCQFGYISVSENPIVCDCHVYNITQAQTTTLDGTCASPPAYKGLGIRSDEFQRKAKEDCKNKHIVGPVKCPWK
ncbi:leucine-rich repeats and immunoglobulin-like domains protein 2 [Liolophura sinensis]|uniref:leucine-rich repeats and immunoglobulin-like domains protein 2 n=1 Tax=Liolophura sinensis TaxID=3198878 RepID=UPI00315881FC